MYALYLMHMHMHYDHLDVYDYMMFAMLIRLMLNMISCWDTHVLYGPIFCVLFIFSYHVDHRSNAHVFIIIIIWIIVIVLTLHSFDYHDWFMIPVLCFMFWLLAWMIVFIKTRIYTCTTSELQIDLYICLCLNAHLYSLDVLV